MEKIKKISSRPKINPKEGENKYGEVEFADEKNKKYPLDTAEHVRAGLRYFGMPKNRSKYSEKDQATIQLKLETAAHKFGIDTNKKSKKGYGFEFGVRTVKAYEYNGKLILEGEASGPEIDQDGERMDKSAIESMNKSILDGIVETDGSLNYIPLNDAHAEDGVLKTLGHLTEATIDSKNNHLKIKSELDMDNPASLSLFKQLEKGKQYGLSVAGFVKDATREFSNELGKNIKVFKDIELREISVTTQPSWAESYLSILSKSYKFKKLKTMKNEEKETLPTVDSTVKEENVIEEKSNIDANVESQDVEKSGKSISGETKNRLDHISDHMDVIKSHIDQLRKGDNSPFADEDGVKDADEDDKTSATKEDTTEEKSLTIDSDLIKSFKQEIDELKSEVDFLKSLPLQPKGVAIQVEKSVSEENELEKKVSEYKSDLLNENISLQEFFTKWNSYEKQYPQIFKK